MALCANFQLCGMPAKSRGRCDACLSLRTPKVEDLCPVCAERGPVAVLPCGHKSCYTCTSVQRGCVNPILYPGLNPPYKTHLVMARCNKCKNHSCMCLVPDLQTAQEALEEFLSRDTAKGECLQCHPRGELPSHRKYLVPRERPDDVWGAEAGEAHEVVQDRVDGMTVVEL